MSTESEKVFTRKQLAIIFKIAFLEAMALSIIMPSVTSSGESNQNLCVLTICQNGVGVNSFLQGADISNTVTITFPVAYKSTPLIICCPFTTNFNGLQPFGLSWSTVFVPQQIRNSTTPSFDVSAKHDQNNSTCSPCTNKVTITPNFLDEVLLVNIFYVSDVTMSVTSVTASGITFTKNQPFGSSATGSDEIWTARTFTTSPIAITVTFNAPASTIVTTSVVATSFFNTNGIIQLLSGSSPTSPISIPFTVSNQYDMIVGNSFLTDAGIACHDPTPGSGQTQILNANAFCASNTNGGVSFLYNYDIEYFKLSTQASYNYNTNFNGTTSTGLSIALELQGNSYHDKLWNIVGTTNSTLYNSDQYDTSLNPPFQSQQQVSTISGRFNFICNYANENVSMNLDLQASVSNTFIDTSVFAGFSANLCDGNDHIFNIVPGYALADNYVGRIRAWCTSCPTPLQISIPNLFIGWRMLGQIQIRESIISRSNTGFQVRWLASSTAPSAYNVNWIWNATGN